MIEINGKHYITEKEASKKYGYSVPWFRLSRKQKDAPPFFRLRENGKILYSIEETDQWFQNRFNLS